MKIITAFISLGFIVTANAQDYSRDITVQLSATVDTSAPAITLNWEENLSPGTSYQISRKLTGAPTWTNFLGSVPSNVLSFTDSTVSKGVSYEYKVDFIAGGTLYAWGYINSSMELELPANRGNILLVVDSTFVVSLAGKIDTLESDLYSDSWRVTTIYVDRNASPIHVKSRILDQYNILDDLKTVYLIGHVPVPYSGDLYPDAHTNHIGAWPADAYYADLDGVWTDNTVSNTSASDTRNHNVPGDGKFDQSTVPSVLELEISRVDFHSMPAFSESEEELLANYLDKAHVFKNAGFVPQEKGLIDDGFPTYQEGFAQNGFRNFTPLFGVNGIDELDYYTTMDTASYLWSFGCGGGSYTSVGSLNNGSPMTTAQLAGGDLQSVFTMLFGSYFGDWDKSNNLMRASIASGKTLSVSWAGRPNWFYHTMAMGNHIGYSAKLSMNKNTGYESIVFSGFVTGEGVHVAQLGDPSLRLYYPEPPSNVLVTHEGPTFINWTASNDPTIDGYNVYRKDSANGLWVKLNSSIVAGTTFSTPYTGNTGTYEFMVKSVKLRTNASGTFYNESLGSVGTTDVVSQLVETSDLNVKIYPNPANDIIYVESDLNIDRLQVMDIRGKLIKEIPGPVNTINVSELNGIYLIQIFGVKNTRFTTKIIVL